MGSDNEQETQPTVIRPGPGSTFRGNLAILLVLGGIHFNFILVPILLYVLPTFWALMFLGLLVVLLVIPLYENSKIARGVATFICKHAATYFPFIFVVEDINAFDPDRTYIFAVEPHSLLPIGVGALSSNTGYLPLTQMKFLGSNVEGISLDCILVESGCSNIFYCVLNFLLTLHVILISEHALLLKWLGLARGHLALKFSTRGTWPLEHFFSAYKVFLIPIVRHIWSWLGMVPASKKSFLKYLKAGYNCVIVPGGVKEIVYMEHDREVVVLKHRYGFVRAAIQTGSALVPGFIFGQGRIYHWYKPKGKLYEHFCRTIGAAPVLFWGKFGSPIPYRKSVYVAVGRPIEVQKNAEPSFEEVEELHAKFLAALQELFEKHKVAAGYIDTCLHII